jgi:GNAT superfamily N-acetyltransferase
MIRTFFLPHKKWLKYGQWLKKQDSETLRNYFGLATKEFAIDQLIQRINRAPEQHHILVASNDNEWLGVIHIATHEETVEFGIIVDMRYRKQGVADLMMDQAITWSRNRYYKYLFMHCISWNLPIKRLCEKYNLSPRNIMGEAEVKMELAPPDFSSMIKELRNSQRRYSFSYHIGF